MKQNTFFLLFALGFILFSACNTTDSKTTGTFTDSRDNKIYKTVKIGDQWWMAENLAATKFNDGNEIPFITKNEEWVSLETPGYSWYNNDVTTHKNTYGGLYNWYAINSGMLAPKGWHIPTDEEWKQLEKNLGLPSKDAEIKGIRGTDFGGKLKANKHWNSPNVGATNESGFAGLPEGHRNWENGGFIDLGLFGTWWSATEEDETTAWRRTLYFDDSNIRRFTSHKRDGFSVRCVKD